MKKYDIIYSIGRDCACASYLEKNKIIKNQYVLAKSSLAYVIV
ncbi:hypothetical protein [Campylobacter lanienae]|nr:hypothetical protein [Campylobacter lanienae]